MWTVVNIVPIYMIIALPSARRIVQIIIIIALSIVLFTDLAIWRSGWKIDGEKLYFKAQFYSDCIDISSMHIGFVSINSEWWPKKRNIGADLPRLAIGKYSMKNQNMALVFNYKNQRELLLISSNGRYYLIGYPEAKMLYEKLINIGARENEFESKVNL